MLNPHQILHNFKPVKSSALSQIQQKIALNNLIKLTNQYEQQLIELLQTYSKIHYTAIPFIQQNKLNKSKFYEPIKLQLDNLDVILKNLHDKDTMQNILNIKKED